MQPDGSTPYGSQAAPRPDLLAVATRARHVVNTLANADMRLCSPPCPGPRCVFYYSGAASRAGLSYSGAILASSDGQWPTLQVGWGAHAGWPSWVAFSSGCLPLGRAQAPLQTGQQACTSLIHRDLQAVGCWLGAAQARSAAVTLSHLLPRCPQGAQQRIEAALQAAGIRPWELSSVDNSNCAGAPLDPSLMALA